MEYGAAFWRPLCFIFAPNNYFETEAYLLYSCIGMVYSYFYFAGYA